MTRGPYKTKPAAGSFADLILKFYSSPTYRDWAPGTVKRNDRFLRALMAANGRMMVADMTRGDVIAARDSMADTPVAASNWLKCLRALLDYAVDLEIAPTNVARERVKNLRPKAPGGFRTWREDEVDAFLAHWKAGTLPHRVMTLALYTAAARVDLVRLGWPNVRGDRIAYTREKTKRHEDELLVDLPITPPLADLLRTIPRTQMTFLETIRGRPRSALSLTNDMALWVLKAGLGDPDVNGRRLNMHGLRKAVGRRLAEAGCSPYEVAAVLGHRNVSSSEPYTKAFSRKVGATNAAEKMLGAPTNVQRIRERKPTQA